MTGFHADLPKGHCPPKLGIRPQGGPLSFSPRKERQKKQGGRDQKCAERDRVGEKDGEASLGNDQGLFQRIFKVVGWDCIFLKRSSNSMEVKFHVKVIKELDLASL